MNNVFLPLSTNNIPPSTVGPLLSPMAYIIPTPYLPIALTEAVWFLFISDNPNHPLPLGYFSIFHFLLEYCGKCPAYLPRSNYWFSRFQPRPLFSTKSRMLAVDDIVLAGQSSKEGSIHFLCSLGSLLTLFYQFTDCSKVDTIIIFRILWMMVFVFHYFLLALE